MDNPSSSSPSSHPFNKMAATESPAKCSFTIDLFEKCWFFRNPFSDAPRKSSTDYVTEEKPILPEIPEKENSATTLSSASVKGSNTPERKSRKLLRQTRSNLESFLPSLEVIKFSEDLISNSAAKLFHLQKPPRDSRVLENIVEYVRSNHEAITWENCKKSSMGGRKWRSLSDLDSREIQGFKDLGFVFDDEAINPSALEIIPGCRMAQSLSPRPSLDWFGGSSPADRKHHLRLWAQVVASSVRQEC